ncbi:helix-turn-helix domain-containing protein [Rhizobium bangladeshense]|uniref:helix-turn-helix domain-containing protein n=1 Tax=Rhizobium bangladeshense TaxID=1138189 RepID=UPI001A998B4B|nr:helix-turn-helix transcriptional regulator [Rhizobium bangladeshense]MBX4932179.1 XRE family transcriptional regulator [Rhizobium bangladeshense]QSY89515.1 XRE family transcriptional regulator [Rhizobium bangladeshense]
MSAREDDRETIVRSSGNVFRDLGIELTPEDEIKIEIAREITRVIQMREYTQKQVAELLCTDQAKVSNIVRGRLSGFSAERLLRFLLSLGVNVDVHLSEVNIGADSAPSEGRVTFHTPLAACG